MNSVSVSRNASRAIPSLESGSWTGTHRSSPKKKRVRSQRIERRAGAPDAERVADSEDDVTDVLLSVLLTKAASGISDGGDHNDAVYLNRSPWLARPWAGFDQGHGRPTP